MLSKFASIIDRFIKFLTSLIENYDEVYDKAGNYLSRNVANGKIFYDFYYFLKRLIEINFRYLQKAGYNMRKRFMPVWNKFSGIPSVNRFLRIVFDTNIIANKFYKLHVIYIFIIFPVTAAMIFLLKNFPEIFFVYFLPVSIGFLYFQGGLYSFIDKQREAIKTTLFKEFARQTGNLYAIASVYLMYVFISCTLLIGIYFMISYIFTIFNTELGHALIFAGSTAIIFLCICLFAFVVYITIIIYHAYFIIVLKNADPIQALSFVIAESKKNTLKKIFASFLLILSALVLTVFTYIYFSEFALLLVIIFILHYFVMFLYCFQFEFSGALHVESIKRGKPAMLVLFSILIFSGSSGYIAFSLLTAQTLPVIKSYLASWQISQRVDINSRIFANNSYFYSLKYPQDWDVYSRDNLMVTFYNNVDNTSSGNLSIIISIMPVAGSEYHRLAKADPGTVILNTLTNEEIRKNANQVVGGKNAIRYSSVKPQRNYIEYQDTCLVLNGNIVYKLTYKAVNKKYYDQNMSIFDSVLKSFEFLD